MYFNYVMTNKHEYLDSKLTEAVTEFKGNAGKIKSGSIQI